MCSVPNIGGISYWHTSELYTSYYKNCDTISMFNPDKDIPSGKHFLTPIGSLHLTQQECNELLLKRAAQQAGQQQMSSADVNCSSNNKSLVNDAPAKIRPYSCNECGKSFLLKHHLTTHSRVHTGERPHICVHCGKSFAHKHCLNTHLLLHSSQRPYRCEECKKSFTLKHHLHTHLRVHNRERPFICDKCGRAFPLKRHLVTHGKYHAGERPYVCPECGESFAQKDHLVMHSRFHGSLNTFACPDCGATFTRKFELVNHGKLHGKIPHRCPICDKEFLQKRTLISHMRCHTATEVVPSASPYPTIKTHPQSPPPHQHYAHSQQQQQQQQHHPHTNKTTTCHECGTTFNTPEALALHLRLHSGDSQTLVTDLCVLTASLHNPHFIPHPGVTPSAPGGAAINLGGKVTQTKIKTHICPHCNKPFAARHGLLQHNKRHPDGCCNIRNHVCSICNKGFFQKNHLLLHQRQHMNSGSDVTNRNDSIIATNSLHVHNTSPNTQS